jgi:hypothetical protein
VDLVREVDLVPFIVILGSLAEASINSKNKFFRLGTMVKRWLMRLFRIRRVLSKMMRWGWLRHRGVLMLVQTRVKNQSRKWEKPLNPRKIRYPNPPFCHRCKSVDHVAKDCRRGWQQNRNDHGNHGIVNRKPLSELIASLCATRSDGQAFFVIPRCASEVNARERINTAVVTILKGEVTTKLIEEEFTRILPGIWRWTARKVVDNMFTVRFPNVQLIKDWNRFNPISLRTMKAKIMVESWNGSVGAKGELQQAWFRVRGVPYDLRNEETMAYVGSLVCSTREVDKATLHGSDYVRIKLAARDVTKVPSVAEGTIDLYLYHFFFEREVVESTPKKAAAQVQINNIEGAASSVKPGIVIRGPSSSNQTQHVESQSSMDGDT